VGWQQLAWVWFNRSKAIANAARHTSNIGGCTPSTLRPSCLHVFAAQIPDLAGRLMPTIQMLLTGGSHLLLIAMFPTVDLPSTTYQRSLLCLAMSHRHPPVTALTTLVGCSFFSDPRPCRPPVASFPKRLFPGVRNAAHLDARSNA
jgi:hypothetical protein